MHRFCVAVLEPVTQKYPPVHVPFGADRPATAQYEPCVHSTCMLMPVLAQNDETGQIVGAGLAIGQYVVGWQRICVDEFEPVGQ